MMGERDDRETHELIREIIGAEEKDALARFRGSGFEAKVRAKLAAAPAAGRGRARIFGLSPAAWGGLAGGAAACALIAALLLPRPATGGDIGARIALVLARNPGVFHQDAGTAGGAEPAGMPSSLSVILTGIVAGRESDAGPAVKEAAATVRRKAERPLSLEEMFKILVIDRSVERALALIS
jgi:hypothetical protein